MKDKDEKTLLIIILVAFGIFLFGGFGFGMMGFGGSYGMMGGYLSGNTGLTMTFMYVFWLLIITFLVLGIIWLWKQIKKK